MQSKTCKDGRWGCFGLADGGACDSEYMCAHGAAGVSVCAWPGSRAAVYGSMTDGQQLADVLAEWGRSSESGRNGTNYFLAIQPSGISLAAANFTPVSSYGEGAFTSGEVLIHGAGDKGKGCKLAGGHDASQCNSTTA